jgi:transposase InsO family protein
MPDELSARLQAIRMRLAGERVMQICKVLGRSEPWFHKWWHRYVATGTDGLYDLTRAHSQLVNRTPAHIERAVLGIRRRLAARATPLTRYALIGAPSIQTELKELGYTPLPNLRTIERILQRANLTSPPLRLARRVSPSAYPGPQAYDSNHVHQVDIVGPRYLTGSKTKYYFLVCKDVFDQSVYAEFQAGCAMAQVLPFLVHAWQRLGLPQYVQFDNGKAFYGWGRWPRSINRIMRLALRLEVQPVFIPEARPQRNGSVENFNHWFQPLLLGRPFRNAAAVRRELQRLLRASNDQHVHQHLGYKTPAQFRRAKRLRKLPANCTLHEETLPIALGKIIFIRWVWVQGSVDILGESIKIGRRLRFQHIKATLYTGSQMLSIHHNGRLLKRIAFKLRLS